MEKKIQVSQDMSTRLQLRNEITPMLAEVQKGMRRGTFDADDVEHAITVLSKLWVDRPDGVIRAEYRAVARRVCNSYKNAGTTELTLTHDGDTIDICVERIMAPRSARGKGPTQWETYTYSEPPPHIKGRVRYNNMSTLSY